MSSDSFSQDYSDPSEPPESEAVYSGSESEDLMTPPGGPMMGSSEAPAPPALDEILAPRYFIAPELPPAMREASAAEDLDDRDRDERQALERWADRKRRLPTPHEESPAKRSAQHSTQRPSSIDTQDFEAACNGLDFEDSLNTPRPPSPRVLTPPRGGTPLSAPEKAADAPTPLRIRLPSKEDLPLCAATPEQSPFKITLRSSKRKACVVYTEEQSEGSVTSDHSDGSEGSDMGSGDEMAQRDSEEAELYEQWHAEEIRAGEVEPMIGRKKGKSPYLRRPLRPPDERVVFKDLFEETGRLRLRETTLKYWMHSLHGHVLSESHCPLTDPALHPSTIGEAVAEDKDEDSEDKDEDFPRLVGWLRSDGTSGTRHYFLRMNRVAGADDEAQIIRYCLPKAVMLRLYPFQRRAVFWMAILYSRGYGGVLADEMGLGKTVQGCVFMRGLIESKLASKILLFTPKNVAAQWSREAARWINSDPVGETEWKQRDYITSNCEVCIINANKDYKARVKLLLKYASSPRPAIIMANIEIWRGTRARESLALQWHGLPSGCFQHSPNAGLVDGIKRRFYNKASPKWLPHRQGACLWADSLRELNRINTKAAKTGGGWYEWDFLLIDESHKFTSDKTKANHYASMVQSRSRVLLTATMIKNFGNELYHLRQVGHMPIFSSRFFKTEAQFKKRVADICAVGTLKSAPDQQVRRREAVNNLVKKDLLPFVLARKRAELPLDRTGPAVNKKDIVLWISVTPHQALVQKEFIQNICYSMLEQEDGVAGDRFQLCLIQKFSFLANHPFLLSKHWDWRTMNRPPPPPAAEAPSEIPSTEPDGAPRASGAPDGRLGDLHAIAQLKREPRRSRRIAEQSPSTPPAEEAGGDQTKADLTVAKTEPGQTPRSSPPTPRSSPRTGGEEMDTDEELAAIEAGDDEENNEVIGSALDGMMGYFQLNYGNQLLGGNNPSFLRQFSAKLQVCHKLIPRLVYNKDESVVIFFKTVRFLELFRFAVLSEFEQPPEPGLRPDGTPVPTSARHEDSDVPFMDVWEYHGKTSMRSREEINKRLEKRRPEGSGKPPTVVLATTKSAGVGLNWRGARYVILAELEWTGAEDDQAVHRVYRLDQTHDVAIIRLCQPGTSDDWKLRKQVAKLATADGYLSESDNTRRIFSTGINRSAMHALKNVSLSYKNMLKNGTVWNFQDYDDGKMPYNCIRYLANGSLIDYQDNARLVGYHPNSSFNTLKYPLLKYILERERDQVLPREKSMKFSATELLDITRKEKESRERKAERSIRRKRRRDMELIRRCLVEIILETRKIRGITRVHMYRRGLDSTPPPSSPPARGPIPESLNTMDAEPTKEDLEDDFRALQNYIRQEEDTNRMLQNTNRMRQETNRMLQDTNRMLHSTRIGCPQSSQHLPPVVSDPEEFFDCAETVVDLSDGEEDKTQEGDYISEHTIDETLLYASPAEISSALSALGNRLTTLGIDPTKHWLGCDRNASRAFASLADVSDDSEPEDDSSFQIRLPVPLPCGIAGGTAGGLEFFEELFNLNAKGEETQQGGTSGALSFGEEPVLSERDRVRAVCRRLAGRGIGFDDHAEFFARREAPLESVLGPAGSEQQDNECDWNDSEDEESEE